MTAPVLVADLERWKAAPPPPPSPPEGEKLPTGVAAYELPAELQDDDDGAAAEEDQLALFSLEPEWMKHWWGMPEFQCRDRMSWHRIVVHFDNEHDLEDFRQLVGQKHISQTTKSIWYPKLEWIEVEGHYRWICRTEGGADDDD